MIKINLKTHSIEYNNFILYLKSFTNHRERNIKRHAHALLIQLQALNPQDDINTCTINTMKKHAKKHWYNTKLPQRNCTCRLCKL